MFNTVSLKGKNTLLPRFEFKAAVCKQLLQKIVFGTKHICTASVDKSVYVGEEWGREILRRLT
jgi:hypothetical protein